jgi:hypothetical protein
VLGLLERHRVEALFCGHVHHFFWNRTGCTDHYLLPATSFVRPEYTELVPVAPSDDEFGRNDVDKLGFALVHVTDSGHQFEPMRLIDPSPREAGTSPLPTNPLGVTMREDLGATHEIPLGNLDAFRRKHARNDLTISALWELGVVHLRVPARDLLTPTTAARLSALVEKGARLHVFTAGAESNAIASDLMERASTFEVWEVVTTDGKLPADFDVVAVAQAGIAICLSVVGQPDPTEYFSHFPPQGFSLGDSRLIGCTAQPIQQVMGRIVFDEPALEQVAGWAAFAEDTALTVAAHLELPRAGEGVAATDDEQVATRIEQAVEAAERFPTVRLFIDTFIDHDRGYYPRHGLLDRGGHPRKAFYRLRDCLRKTSILEL